jgi:hypothetical protein
MSQLENGKYVSPIYSYQFPVMAAGTVNTTTVAGAYILTSLVNFRPSCSRILGVVLVTAGGTVGTPYVNNLGALANSTTDGYLPQLQLRSSSNADTSVYKMYWTNEVGSSNLATILPC